MKTHKHEGLLTSKGALRSHPVNRKHTNSKVLGFHNQIIGKNSIYVTKKATFNKGVVCPVDNDGYIHIDLTQEDITQVGIRIKFERIENNKKRVIGLEINKQGDR